MKHMVIFHSDVALVYRRVRGSESKNSDELANGLWPTPVCELHWDLTNLRHDLIRMLIERRPSEDVPKHTSSRIVRISFPINHQNWGFSEKANIQHLKVNRIMPIGDITALRNTFSNSMADCEASWDHNSVLSRVTQDSPSMCREGQFFHQQLCLTPHVSQSQGMWSSKDLFLLCKNSMHICCLGIHSCWFKIHFRWVYWSKSTCFLVEIIILCVKKNQSWPSSFSPFCHVKRQILTSDDIRCLLIL